MGQSLKKQICLTPYGVLRLQNYGGKIERNEFGGIFFPVFEIL